MTASGVSVHAADHRRPIARTVSLVLVGLVAGAVLYYVTAVGAALGMSSGFSAKPVSLVLVAAVGVVAVVVGWLWRTVGMVAGVVVLLVVMFAIVERLSWSSSAGDWASPTNAIALGAVSGYPAMLGAVLVTVSALRPRKAFVD